MLNIVSWNCKDRALELIDTVGGFGADIVFLAEACPGDVAEADIRKLATECVRRGYRMKLCAYRDTDNRADRHCMAMLVQDDIAEEPESLWLGSRRALTIRIADLTIIGVHLDDRSDQTRLQQVDALLDFATERTIIVGDFNAAHPGTTLGTALRRLKPITGRLPRGEPGTSQSRLARVGSLATRLTEMTNSSVMPRLLAAGFHDADVLHRPTMLGAGLPVAQLDHAVASSDCDATAKPFGASGSDHLPLRVTVS